MPGEHTIVSRAIDIGGAVQPVATDVEAKLTTLETWQPVDAPLRLSRDALAEPYDSSSATSRDPLRTRTTCKGLASGR